MLTQICMVVITVMLIALVVVLIRIFFQMQQSIRLLQTDLHNLFGETTGLAKSLNAFVQTDLNMISQETSQLISNLNDLSADINNKSHSLNFLFKPLSFLNSKLGPDSSDDESTPKQETIPQIVKWIASSAVLFKTTKELINRYGKQK